MTRLVRGLTIPVILLVLWEVAGQLGWIADYLSRPSEVAAALWGVTVTGELGEHLAASCLRAFSGFALGATFGVMVGLASGVVGIVRNFFEPLVSLLYPIPKIAFLPIIVLWLGLGDASKIVIIAISVSFPTFIASFYAARSVDSRLVWSARSMGASQLRVFFQVIAPAAMPQVFAGLRVGLALAFIVLFAAELMGARAGLGYLITDAEESVRFDLMFAGIVSIALVGFASDRLLLATRKRVLRGQLAGTQEREAP